MILLSLMTDGDWEEQMITRGSVVLVALEWQQLTAAYHLCRGCFVAARKRIAEQLTKRYF